MIKARNYEIELCDISIVINMKRRNGNEEGAYDSKF